MADECVTLAEVRDLLTAENGKRELLTSQRNSMTHAQAVCSLTMEQAKAMVAELEGLDFVETPVAVKIADLMPKYPNDVRAIFAKERVPLDAGRIAAVLDVVDRYR